MASAEEALKRLVQFGDHEGDGAEQPAVALDRGGDIGRKAVIEDCVDAEERDGLQLDAAGPAVAHLGEDRPGNAVLRRQRVEMGAEQRRAVGVGGAQR